MRFRTLLIVASVATHHEIADGAADQVETGDRRLVRGALEGCLRAVAGRPVDRAPGRPRAAGQVGRCAQFPPQDSVADVGAPLGQEVDDAGGVRVGETWCIPVEGAIGAVAVPWRVDEDEPRFAVVIGPHVGVVGDAGVDRRVVGGMRITPQLGLFPIGRDPGSGLWEFAHLQTGEPALRGSDGKLTINKETGLVLVQQTDPYVAAVFSLGAQPTGGSWPRRGRRSSGTPRQIGRAHV